MSTAPSWRRGVRSTATGPGRNRQSDRRGWRSSAAALEKRVPDIATTISQEVGMPITMSTTVQAQLPVRIARTFATLASDVDIREEVGNSIVVREPFGVVGMIVDDGRWAST